MSLAYKLWKIGSVLSLDDMRECIQEDIPDKLVDPEYINIDFQFNDNNRIESIILKQEGVEKKKFFFSKKIGGSGGGIYYLYPNLIVQDEQLGKKISQLKNTSLNSCLTYANKKNKLFIKEIQNLFSTLDLKNDIEKIEKKQKENNKGKKNKKITKIKEELKEKKISKNVLNQWDKLEKKVSEFKKSNYIIFFSINGKTFYEVMPEVWKNWYKVPAIKDKHSDREVGYDSFTNKETEVGFKPDIRVLSYDQYPDDYKYRVSENLPLSQESARNIKFAWIYILKKLVFNYKGVEYVTIPNILIEDSEIYRIVLNRLVSANKKSETGKSVLKKLLDKEKKLKSDLEKLKKKKDKIKSEKYDQLKQSFKEIEEEIDKKELGLISELDEQANEIGDYKDSITLDYIFTSINKTDLSFEIKGTVEDVIPGRISNVVEKMREYGIDENVKLKSRNNRVLLQDYFNRDELYFIVNQSQSKNKNKIFKEKINLVYLLLTDQKISLDKLLNKFQFNREYKYNHTKRVSKDGIKEWISFPDKFVSNEESVYNFLRSLDKIKE